MTVLNQFQTDAIHAQFKEGKLSIHKIAQLNSINKEHALKMYGRWLAVKKAEFRNEKKNRSIFTEIPKKPTVSSYKGALFYTLESLTGEELRIANGMP